MPDEYSALWVSYSSISDFIACPRAYFLKNVYKDVTTGRKIRLAHPSLSLGSAVHGVLETLSILPKDKRFDSSPLDTLDTFWSNYSGLRGGFASPKQEEEYKARARMMIERVVRERGPLQNFAVKIQMNLPHFYLSEQDNIILSGKIDWLEYLPENDGVHIIDFKTSKQESPESLQMPIYTLLVTRTQSKLVKKTSYWYLERDNGLVEVSLSDNTQTEKKIIKIAKQISLARKLGRFKCPRGEIGCQSCRSYEAILRGRARLVGIDESNRDVYVLHENLSDEQNDIVIL